MTCLYLQLRGDNSQKDIELEVAELGWWSVIPRKGLWLFLFLCPIVNICTQYEYVDQVATCMYFVEVLQVVHYVPWRQLMQILWEPEPILKISDIRLFITLLKFSYFTEKFTIFNQKTFLIVSQEKEDWTSPWVLLVGLILCDKGHQTISTSVTWHRYEFDSQLQSLFWSVQLYNVPELCVRRRGLFHIWCCLY